MNVSARTTCLAAIALASVAALFACVPAPTVLDAPPNDPRAASTVYVVERNGAPSFVYVSSADDPGAAPFPELARRSGETLRVSAVRYACPAPVYGLTLGPHAVLPDGQGHALPPLGEVSSATIDDGGASAWSPASTAPAVRVDRALECAHFDLHRKTIPATHTDTSTESFTYPTFGIPNGDGSVTVAISDGRYFRVSELDATPVETAGAPYLAHYRAPDGSLWLFGPNGRLAHGDFERGFEEMPRAADATGQYRAWLDGPHDASAPFELFALDDSGAFLRFDGEGWETIHYFERNPDDRFQNEIQIFGGVAWVGPGEGLAVSEWSTAAVRYRVGGEPMLEYPYKGTDRAMLRVLRWLPRLGPVIGAVNGRIYLPDGAEWREINGSPITGFGGVPAITDLAMLDEGLLIGGALGRFTQYMPDREEPWCNYRETMPVEGLEVPENLAQFFVSGVVELPCGYALLSKESSFAADVEVTFLTRTP